MKHKHMMGDKEMNAMASKMMKEMMSGKMGQGMNNKKHKKGMK